jgi:methylenetetrahydrofolate--tRNA-(uracil-5-)-methyltransferase
VVQLRPENSEGTAYNMVGFQTRLTWPEQKRIFRTLPGLAGVEFLRMGQIHRNTFLNSPQLLRGDLSLASHPNIFLAGQIAGVEGYVESIASGLLTAFSVLARRARREFSPPPAQTALGGLYSHLTTPAKHGEYQPSNITFGLLPALDKNVHKSERRKQIVLRARQAIQHWRSEVLSSILSSDLATVTL